ncbi:MAG: hypothetical protein J7L31_06430 [Thermoplasmata archaeon]|nr:hypothetical protein [Thermoplasmata archaeon]
MFKIKIDMPQQRKWPVIFVFSCFAFPAILMVGMQKMRIGQSFIWDRNAMNLNVAGASIF